MINEENNKRLIKEKMDNIESQLNELLRELNFMGFELFVDKLPETDIQQLNGKCIKTPARFWLTASKTVTETI